MMGSRIGITLIEVGGASACGGLEAEGQKYFTLCLSPSFLRINSVILERIAPEPKITLFPIFIRIIPVIQHSIVKCGWYKPVTLMDNGLLQKLRKLEPIYRASSSSCFESMKEVADFESRCIGTIGAVDDVSLDI